jgi:hypothetical protein
LFDAALRFPAEVPHKQALHYGIYPILYREKGLRMEVNRN